MRAQRHQRAAAAGLALVCALSGSATAAYAASERGPGPEAQAQKALDRARDAVADVVTPAREDTLADATPEQRACIHRNDDVEPWGTARGATESWDRRGAQKAHVRIISALRKRFHTRGGSSFEITNGLLGYDLDTVNSRLIMLLDPDLLDLAEFRGWVRKVAAQANKTEQVKGRPVTVTVQAGCFPAAKAMDVLVHEWESGAEGVHSTVELDGRLHFYIYPRQRAAAQAFRERHGPIVAIDPCGPCPRPL